MSVVENLLALPPGQYWIHLDNSDYVEIERELSERGAIYIHLNQDDLYFPPDEENLQGKAIIMDGYHEYFRTIIWNLVGLGCRIYRLDPSGLFDYCVEGGRLIASDNPPWHDHMTVDRIDETIKQVNGDISDLQKILSKLEDLRFTTAKKPAAKYLRAQSNALD